jgi:eukaryotic-like serine/threonine-protein kinase
MSPEPAEDPLIGHVAGNFRLVRLIGEGGMSSVYIGERIKDFEQSVAVKLLREGLYDPEIRQRFLAEQQVLASLRHPDIVQLIDGGVTADGVPYLVMEYVEGTPLDEYCESRHVSIADRIDLMIRVLEAVEYAHQRQIAHCDLKFSNILVASGGAHRARISVPPDREGTPKAFERHVPACDRCARSSTELRLLDFGITKLLDPGRFGLDAQLTRATARPFTPEFASPEQLRGQALGAPTDIYSAGVILYILLTGKHPFEAVRDEPVQLLRATLSSEPQPPSRCVSAQGAVPAPPNREELTKRLGGASSPRPLCAFLKNTGVGRQLRGDLDSIALKALRKEPERRYANAAQFAADLRNYLEAKPVMAQRVSLRYRAWKFVKRNRAMAAAAAVALIASTLGAGGVLWESVRAERSRVVAQRRFEDARKLTSTLLVDFYQSVQKLDRSGPALESLVRWSRETLDRLAAQSGGDASFETDLAESYLKLGILESGEPVHAIESLDRGLVLADAALRRDPGNHNSMLVKARLLQSRSVAEEAVGKTLEAERDAVLARQLSGRLRK